MTTHFKIDHIVIMVDDLTAAMADYATMGFTVLPGGTHADNPTHNALIVFADGVYIEIIALLEGSQHSMSERLKRWHKGSPGLVDFALLPQDIDADIASARQRGLPIEDAEPGGRKRPDGQEIVWKTANLPGAGLPFFCYDVTPRALRVPEGDVRQQPNGATGVANITIAVADLEVSSRQYQALLGIAPQAGPAMSNTQTTRFKLGMGAIILAQPTQDDSPLKAYIEQAGERPYSFQLYTNDATKATSLDTKLAHQAHIDLVT